MRQLSTSQKTGLKENLLNWRTLFGFIIAAFVVYIFIKSFDLHEALAILSQAEWPFILLSAIVFYLSLPLRGWRWGSLLRPANIRINYISLSHYYLLSWFVNAILPARIGDIYRAYLLKKNREVPVSLSLGVIVSERVIDLGITAILVLISGTYFWSALRGSDTIRYIGWAIAVVAVICLLFTVLALYFGKLKRYLPQKWKEHANQFSRGLFRKPVLLPLIIVMTATIWLSEALRLYFVFWALNIKAGFLTALFISQVSLILMSLPISPAGLGLVELLMLKLLASAGITASLAGAATIADRLISYWSLVAIGAIVYIISPRQR